MTAHRQSPWIVILCIALLAGPANLFAMTSTPVTDDTQLYIDHFARLTARIPAEWAVSPGWGVYEGDNGVIAGNATAASTLAEACDDMVAYFSAAPAVSTIDPTFEDDTSCRIDIPDSFLDGRPLTAMVLPHPEPFMYQGETIAFVAIATDPEHFEEILSTVSFDLSSLTGRQIAHSILDSVEALTFHASTIDWDAMRIAADTVETPGQVNRFLEMSLLPAIRAAGDTNAFLIPTIADETIGEMPPSEVPTGHWREGIGYLRVPGTGLPDDWPGYVDAGFDTINAVAEDQTCGWIIDLRGNQGGNLAIMLQALTPFFPEGRILGFVDAAGGEIWVTRQGDEILYDTVLYGIPDTGPVPVLAHPDVPIAVLINQRTASAGEMTLLGLMSHPNMRSFGLPTGGFLGANVALPLLDGSTLVFGAGAMLDAEGNIHTTVIEPDEEVRGRILPSDDDKVVMAAEAWLLEQPACQGIATPVAAATPVD